MNTNNLLLSYKFVQFSRKLSTLPTNIQFKLNQISTDISRNHNHSAVTDILAPESCHADLKLQKKAAVLVPLCFHNDKLSLLYTARSRNLNKHAGQISFPGGQCDDTDRDVVHTALRETEEEIGIDSTQVHVYGTMKPMPDRLLTTSIHPVIAFVTLNDFQFKVNAAEVTNVFTLSLEELCLRHKYTRFRFRTASVSQYDYTLPVYDTNPCVWGITAVITENLLNMMLGMTIYHERHS